MFGFIVLPGYLQATTSERVCDRLGRNFQLCFNGGWKVFRRKWRGDEMYLPMTSFWKCQESLENLNADSELRLESWGQEVFCNKDLKSQ